MVLSPDLAYEWDVSEGLSERMRLAELRSGKKPLREFFVWLHRSANYSRYTRLDPHIADQIIGVRTPEGEVISLLRKPLQDEGLEFHYEWRFDQGSNRLYLELASSVEKAVGYRRELTDLKPMLSEFFDAPQEQSVDIKAVSLPAIPFSSSNGRIELSSSWFKTRKKTKRMRGGVISGSTYMPLLCLREEVEAYLDPVYEHLGRIIENVR